MEPAKGSKKPASAACFVSRSAVRYNSGSVAGRTIAKTEVKAAQFLRKRARTIRSFISPANSCWPEKYQPKCRPHSAHWQCDQAWPGNHVYLSVGTPVWSHPQVSEKVMMSKRIPSGFENVNSSLPSKQNRSRSFATRLWHQAHNQSPSPSCAAEAVRESSSGWARTGVTGSVSPEAFQFTNRL